MKALPNLTVQLIHMQGPLKGQIQEFAKSEISIGRHPSCDVVFPADLQALSRQHAKLIREGNRFKIIDSSTNGTTVNGQKISEQYLKNGDVLTFSMDGPKVSFSSQTSALQPEPSSHIQPTSATHKPQHTAPVVQKPVNNKPVTKPPQRSIRPQSQQGNTTPVKISLLIQYGPTLQSYDSLPITIGSNPGCDFVLATAGIADRHASIAYKDQQYLISDLTGRTLISVNSTPVTQDIPLNPDDIISLSTDGPVFKFLAGGRLMQQELSVPPEPLIMPVEENKPVKSKSFLGKYFQRS